MIDKTNHKENLRKTYNVLAKDWNEDHTHDQIFAGVRKFIGLLNKDEEILDIGCGSGLYAKIFQEVGLKVTGIDLSEKMIEFSHQNAPECDFFVMDMENMTFEKKFDAIFARASLLHSRKKDGSRVVQHWVDFLKPGGYIFIAVKEKKENGKDEDVLHENDYGYDYERFFSFYTKKEIEDYLKATGIKVIYSIVGRRPGSSGSNSWIQTIGRKK